jgi:integrase
MAIEKVRPGRYRITWYSADRRERQKTVNVESRAQAEQIARALLAERDQGPPATLDPSAAPALRAFAETWVEEHRIGWKATTLDQYRQVLRHQVVPTFGELRVNQVTESAVRVWMTTLHDAGLSARRINLALLVLKMVLRKAVRAKWITDGDPLEAIKMLAEPEADIDPLSPEEITTFLASCPPWWRSFFVIAFYTGARPGELGALRWADLDTHANTFRIARRVYRGVLDRPKTRASVRDVDLLPPTLEAVRHQKAQQAAQRLRDGTGIPALEQDWIFTGPDGGRLNVNYIRERVWRATLRTAGLRFRTFYQTRHSFASNALAAGEDPAWVARQLGHKNVELVFTTYAKWIPTRTRRDGSALVARFQASASPKSDADVLRTPAAGGANSAREPQG